MDSALVSKFQELEKVEKKTQFIREITGIGIVIIFLAFAISLYVNIKSFDYNRFMDILKGEIFNTSLPVYKKELKKIAVKVAPVIQQEFQKQLPSIETELLKTLKNQSDILIADLKKEVDRDAQDMLNIDFKQLILQAIPELKNEPNIDAKLNQFVTKYEEELKRKLHPANNFAYQDKLFNSIQESLNEIVAQTPPSMKQKNIFDLFSYVYNIVHSGELEKLLKKDAK